MLFYLFCQFFILLILNHYHVLNLAHLQSASHLRCRLWSFLQFYDLTSAGVGGARGSDEAPVGHRVAWYLLKIVELEFREIGLTLQIVLTGESESSEATSVLVLPESRKIWLWIGKRHLLSGLASSAVVLILNLAYFKIFVSCSQANLSLRLSSICLGLIPECLLRAEEIWSVLIQGSFRSCTFIIFITYHVRFLSLT